MTTLRKVLLLVPFLLLTILGLYIFRKKKGNAKLTTPIEEVVKNAPDKIIIPIEEEEYDEDEEDMVVKDTPSKIKIPTKQGEKQEKQKKIRQPKKSSMVNIYSTVSIGAVGVLAFVGYLFWKNEKMPEEMPTKPDVIPPPDLPKPKSQPEPESEPESESESEPESEPELTFAQKKEREKNSKDLLKACHFGNVSTVNVVNTVNTVRKLLALPPTEIDVNVPGKRGNTPSHVACGTGNTDIVKLLLKNDEVDFEKTNKLRQTPFFVACSWESIAVIKELLKQKKKKIGFNIKDKYNRTPFYFVCSIPEKVKSKKVKSKKVDIVKVFLKEGKGKIKFNMPGEEGRTPFWAACRWGNLEIVKLLLKVNKTLPKKNKIKFNMPNDDGRTPFWAACRWGKLEVVKLLLKDKRINFKQAGKQGETPSDAIYEGMMFEEEGTVLRNNYDSIWRMVVVDKGIGFKMYQNELKIEEDGNFAKPSYVPITF